MRGLDMHGLNRHISCPGKVDLAHVVPTKNDLDEASFRIVSFRNAENKDGEVSLKKDNFNKDGLKNDLLLCRLEKHNWDEHDLCTHPHQRDVEECRNSAVNHEFKIIFCMDEFAELGIAWSKHSTAMTLLPTTASPNA